MNNRLAFGIQRHLRSMQVLTALVVDLNQMGVDYRILKGIPLNQQLYGQHLKRESRDIDVLIRPENIERVHHLLLEQGYELLTSVAIETIVHSVPFLLGYWDEIHYIHPEKMLAIDLKWHTCLNNYKGMSWSSLTDFQCIDIQGQPVKILTNEQNFSYLSVHGAKHLWAREQWLNDLVVFYQKIPFVWEDMLYFAQSTGAIRPLYEAKVAIQRQFQVILPEVPHTILDTLAVQIRMIFMKANWYQNLHKRSFLKRFLGFVLNTFLYPTLYQKYHYILRIFVARKPVLTNIVHLKNPGRLPIFISALTLWR